MLCNLKNLNSNIEIPWVSNQHRFELNPRPNNFHGRDVCIKMSKFVDLLFSEYVEKTRKSLASQIDFAQSYGVFVFMKKLVGILGIS